MNVLGKFCQKVHLSVPSVRMLRNATKSEELMKIILNMQNKRSSGLSVRRRRDRHPKWPVKSGDSAPRRSSGDGRVSHLCVRISVRKRPHPAAGKARGEIDKEGWERENKRDNCK